MKKLTAIQVARATKPGLYSDGGGLYLQVASPTVRSWIYRYSLNGKARYMGLGSASAITLKRARELVTEPRRLHAEGIDPIEQKHAKRTAARLAAAKSVTFRECAERYIAAHEHTWKNPTHRRQWRISLETDVYPTIGGLPVQDINTALVLSVLQPIWNAKPVSAGRVRGRIEAVLDAAKSADLRTGENPARWRGHLENLLAAPGKVKKVEHLAALPYREVPAFMAELCMHTASSAHALEFTVLTACRTSEVLGAKWSEIDFAQRVWTVPGDRMKAGKEHKVPLSRRTLEILRGLHGQHEGEFIFASRPSGRPLDITTMLKMLQRTAAAGLTVHGFRSTFRDWAAEQTSFPSEVVEMALAHAIRGAVEAAYRRGDLFEKRARLMAAWSDYCGQAAAHGAIVPIRK